MRCILTLICSLLLSGSVIAQTPAPSGVQLSLAADKSSYRIGEPIILELEFIAGESGYSVNSTTTEPASPIDDKTDIPQDEAALQSELIRAVIQGLNWQLSKEEADVFRRQCLSDLRRSQAGVKE